MRDSNNLNRQDSLPGGNDIGWLCGDCSYCRLFTLILRWRGSKSQHVQAAVGSSTHASSAPTASSTN